jgi:threonine aldolase
MGDKSHLTHYERGGLAALGSVFPVVIPNQQDGTISLDKIKYEIPSCDDQHIVKITGISLESTHNNCGGRVI